MNISRWKIIWKFITGGGTGVVDYLLAVLRNALNGIGDANKNRILAVLNLALKVLSIAKFMRVFIPVRWQIAYDLTIKAIGTLVSALQDLEITGEELKVAIADYNAAYAAWMQPEDETCVEMVKGPFGTFVAKVREA